MKQLLNNKFKVTFLTMVTSVFMIGCGDNFKSSEFDNDDISMESTANNDFKEAQASYYFISNKTLDSKDSSNENLTDEEIIELTKERFKKILESMDKIDVTKLPEGSEERLKNNIESVEAILKSLNEDSEEADEFRQKLVDGFRAAAEMNKKGVSDEQKALFKESTCRAMKQHLENGVFPNVELKKAVQKDFDKSCN